MIALLALFACGPSDPPTGPSAEASAATAEAVCKLFEAARVDCAHEGGRVTAGPHRLEFVTVIELEKEALGFRSLVMRVQPTVEGVRRPELDTPAAVNGGEPREALLDRAMHEWALVHGAALVDLLLDDPDRPALRSVTPDVQSGRRIGTADVFRGWTLLQGGSALGIEHDKLLPIVWPVVEALPAGVHTAGIRIDHEADDTRWRCEIDGVESAALCEAARRYAWPLARPLTRVRQYYVFRPAAEVPPVEAAEAEAP